VAAEDQALDARKSTILRRVISEHIQTGQPIGSAHVVRDGEIDVSAATVRSDMAALEREGYLTHPHTSAGRVPTDKGYRFFVDQLDASALDPAREEQVEAFFERAHGQLERMLRDTSRLLSQLTDYASVVVAPTHGALSVRSSLLTRLGPRTALLVVVLSDGAVEQRSLEIDGALTDDDVERANQALREQLPGQTLGRLASPKTSGNAAVDRLVRSCCAVLPGIPASEPGDEDVYVGGASHMADQFTAVDTVREVLGILEQSFVVVSLISDLLAQGRSVAIGAESGLASLAECSLVVAPYEVGNEFVGTIGVLGPTRMNYPQALATVAVVSQRLSHELSGS
jgi:heat-inducible transcriptional repressor